MSSAESMPYLCTPSSTENNGREVGTQPSEQLADDVCQLRAWGTNVVHSLQHPEGELVIGHARVVRCDGKSMIETLDHAHVIRIDGVATFSAPLLAGVEVEINNLIFIAESSATIAQRRFLARLVGFGESNFATIDRALRTMRRATTRAQPIVLTGEGDLVPIARRLHVLMNKTVRPFVVVDPRRTTSGATVRTDQSTKTAHDAMRVAGPNGTICILMHRRPKDFAEVLNDRCTVPRIVVCAHSADPRMMVSPIAIPGLRSRTSDIDRVIAEYLADAADDLGTRRCVLDPRDDAWLRKHAGTFAEIETGTRRLVAIRSSVSISQAAGKLGMTYVSLADWSRRWRLPAL